ncbi:(2Fe-2S) ferredoxin domain-containing protein [bacterium]|nr:(2Fe-2S) ferredoxin domain-containing protein [bacterium]
MAVKSLADLKKMSSEFKNTVSLRENGDNVDSLIQIKVAMATCGIASGAKEVMDFYLEELDKQGIKAVVTQTGCMGYCYAEPTIEVKLPGKEPIVFGHVNVEKASEILEKYIKNGELVEGIIPVNYETVK